MTPKKKAGWAAIAVTIVAGFEGIRQYAYRDPIGIPTICFGETKGVKIGDRATIEECKGMLLESLELAHKSVSQCVKVPMTDKREAALVSFAYNIGGGAFCKSTLVKKLNSGDTVGACNELPKWDKANGIVLAGLTKRREEERKLCLEST
jgi:lysozyme